MSDFGKELDFMDVCKIKFSKYREERIKKECPMCSDLWHGFYEGMLSQQEKINSAIGIIELIAKKEVPHSYHPELIARQWLKENKGE